MSERVPVLRLVYVLSLSALIGATSVCFGAEGITRRVEVSTDRSSYRAGETATVSLQTHPAGPTDLYVILTTPSGRRLYADSALQFRRYRAPAVANFMLAEGQVEVPLSLATSDLARPGEYKIDIYLSPPGSGEEAGELSGTAKFVVNLPDGPNFLAVHDPKSPRYDNDCAACHVDKTRNVSLAPGIPSFHTIKYRMFSAAGLSRSCSVSICHDGADLTEFSQGALHKQSASPDYCAQCHGAFGPGKKLFSK